MTKPDKTQGGERRSSDRLDPSFLKRLEDDSLWHSSARTRPARPRPPRKERRSRMVAVIVLVVAAVVILITGLTAGAGDSGSPGGGQSSPFSLLPLPNNSVTSTTAVGTSSAFDPSLPTSTPLTTVPVAAVLWR